MNYITTSIRVELKNVLPTQDNLIYERLIRPQRSASRLAYNRLLEDVGEKAIWQLLRQKFPLLTGRNLNDAIIQAKGILSSQRERLPERVALLNKQIERAKTRYQTELVRKGQVRPDRLMAIEKRLQRLIDRQAELQIHLENSTVPPAVFGGKKRWRQVSRRLLEARADWRAVRNNQFYSRGAKNYNGNPHCRLILNSQSQLKLNIRVPDKLIKKGKTTTTSALWFEFDLTYSRQYEPLLFAAAVDGMAETASYDVRLMRLLSGQYRAYITVDEPVVHREYGLYESIPEWCECVAGIDLNLDHLAIVISDRQGQFRDWRVFKYNNLGELPQDKTEWRIGNMAVDVVDWLKKLKVQALVIEDLNIKQNGGGYPALNRRTVPFAYRQLREALARRALREGLVVKVVNPAYTSWIGRLKYAKPLGVSTHIAAAYVIARRGMGLQERIPRKLLEKFPVAIAMLKENIGILEAGVASGQDQQLKTRREWLKRLENWKSYSPEAGKPWLLWVTLYLVSKNISGVRAGLI